MLGSPRAASARRGVPDQSERSRRVREPGHLDVATQLADRYGWLGRGTAGGGRRKRYFGFYSPGKPNRQFILVWPPCIVGSVVSMHLTILLDNNRNPEKKLTNGLPGWAGLAGWFPRVILYIH